MFMRTLYDERLAHASYLIGCQKSGDAIVIDPARDIDQYTTLADKNSLRITAVAETHIHADFVSGARELAQRLGAHVYVSDEGPEDWRSEWLSKKEPSGSYPHTLLRDGDTFSVGNIAFQTVHTPGHTPEHIGFLVTDKGSDASEPVGFLTGDFLFVGDVGRPDLLETAAGQTGSMEPSARQLFRSLSKLNKLPPFTQVWPAHGAGSACGKSLGAVLTSTIGYEQRFNKAMNSAVNEDEFVQQILAGQPDPPLYFARMKRVNKEGPAILGDLPTPPHMSVSNFRELDPRKVAIIDTRPWEAFRSGHIPGSLSFPLIGSFPTDTGSLVREGEDICLIVEPGMLEEVLRNLVRVGLDNIRGWVEAGKVHDYTDPTHPLARIEEITPEESQKLLEGGKASPLDVRRTAEFESGHVPGALNIAHTRLPAHMESIPTDLPLVVNCRSGVRSGRATAYLARQGLRAINVKGGILAWEQANLPMES